MDSGMRLAGFEPATPGLEDRGSATFNSPSNRPWAEKRAPPSVRLARDPERNQRRCWSCDSHCAQATPGSHGVAPLQRPSASRTCAGDRETAPAEARLDALSPGTAFAFVTD